MCSTKLSQHTILYVDDDQDDMQLLQEAVYKVSNSHTFVEAYNGEEGLEQLEYMKASNNLPCLIVMDINMPKMDGRQAFKKIRSDKTLAQIPLVIFSTSDSALDKMYFKGDNVEYITKPVNYTHLLQVAERLLGYCN